MAHFSRICWTIPVLRNFSDAVVVMADIGQRLVELLADLQQNSPFEVEQLQRFALPVREFRKGLFRAGPG